MKKKWYNTNEKKKKTQQRKNYEKEKKRDIYSFILLQLGRILPSGSALLLWVSRIRPLFFEGGSMGPMKGIDEISQKWIDMLGFGEDYEDEKEEEEEKQ